MISLTSLFRSRLVALAFVVGILLAILLPLPVSALGDPDSIDIIEARVYRNLWETGDLLAVIEYNVEYVPPPGTGDPASDNFLVGLQLSGVSGPGRYLNYYQVNLISVYLTPAQVTTYGYDNYVEGGYKVLLLGNPISFSPLVEDLNMDTYPLSTGQWIDLPMVQARSSLGAWCLGMAPYFEDEWGYTILANSTKINSEGRVQFELAIPSLSYICPSIFTDSASLPVYEGPTYYKTYEGNLTARSGARLRAALDGLGEWLLGRAGYGSYMGGLGLGILFFILAGRVYVATGSAPAAIVLCFPFLIAGNLIGVLPLALTFILVFLVVVVFSMTFLLARLS